MIGTIVWCMMEIANPDGELVETAVKGKVTGEPDADHFFVDFSDYAKKQGYKGHYEHWWIAKDVCSTEKELK